MSFIGLLLVLILQVSLICRLCNAQTHTFQWTFADSSQQISSTLPECESLAIVVSSSTSNSTALGTPPYYLLAIEAGGFSTISLVGTDPNNLSWQVNHAAGTQLLLSMADANGNAGGMATALFTVASGQYASCLPTPPSTSLAITPNVTMDLATCEPWGLTVTGGEGPYNVSLASVGSTVVTNVTLPTGFDVLTFINRVNPNSQILAAISDSTGKFGKSTPVVNTVGSSNLTCAGLVTKPGQSSRMRSSMSHHTATIVVVCVLIGSLIVVVGVILYMRRRVRLARGTQDTRPRIFKNEDVNDPAHAALLPTPRSDISFDTSYRKLSKTDTMTTDLSHSSSSTFHPYQEIVPYMPNFYGSWHSGHERQLSSASSSHSQDRPLPPLPPLPLDSPNYSISNYPTSPPYATSSSHGSTFTQSGNARPDADQRYAKVAEAYRSTRSDNIRRVASPSSPSSAGHSHITIAGQQHSADHRRVDSDPDAEPDIIIQHRDGGIVQELPPPYLDRSRNRPPLDNDGDVVGS